MKEKIIIFIIGLLLGAIISTGSIYFYSVATGSNKNDMQMQNGNAMGNPMEQNANTQGNDSDQNGGTPPEIPDNDNQGNNQGE